MRTPRDDPRELVEPLPHDQVPAVVTDLHLRRPALGAVDAAVVTIAERFGIERIDAVDRRRFNVVRPHLVDALTLLPRPPE